MDEELADTDEIKIPIGRSGFGDIRRNGYYRRIKAG